MSRKSSNSRLEAFIVGAAKKHVSRSDLVVAIRDTYSMLERMEFDDPGLTRRLANLLEDPLTFKGSSEETQLRMAIGSAVGELLKSSKSVRPTKLTRQVPLTDEELADRVEPDPAREMDREERRRILEDALQKAIHELKPELRTAITETYLNRRKQSEVCRELGVPDSTLNSQIERGVEILGGKLRHLREFYSTDLYEDR